MKRYENVYDFNVLDEIKKGETIYLIDRAKRDNNFAVTNANKTCVEKICEILTRNNNDNRYQFFKVVETEDKANEE